MATSVNEYMYEQMPPPKKRYKNGTKEFDEALQSGVIEISLPLPDIVASVESTSPTSASAAADFDNTDAGQIDGASSQSSIDGCSRESKQYSESEEDGRPTLAHISVVSCECEDGSNSERATNDGVFSLVNNASSVKFQSPDPSLPRFSDIIGHGHAKLRIEEVLLPMALPITVTNSVLTGEQTLSVFASPTTRSLTSRSFFLQRCSIHASFYSDVRPSR